MYAPFCFFVKIYNIFNYKNVFYGYGAFEIGKIDNVICINENVITGYYIYDKELGLIKVNRFANGERLDNDGIEKLSIVFDLFSLCVF